MSKRSPAASTHAATMRTRSWHWLAVAVAFALLVTLLQFVRSENDGRPRGSIFTRRDTQHTVSPGNGPVLDGLPFAKSWGAYSPAFPRAEYSVPRGCKVTMVSPLRIAYNRHLIKNQHRPTLCVLFTFCLHAAANWKISWNGTAHVSRPAARPSASRRPLRRCRQSQLGMTLNSTSSSRSSGCWAKTHSFPLAQSSTHWMSVSHPTDCKYD